jgi:hypothetical protein
MSWSDVSIFWCLVWVVCRISDLWSYASAIETAVLVVILYDIIWHRWNAIREIKRDEEVENHTIEREQALEQRQIRRERQEILRKHWQELQANLISLQRSVSHLVQARQFIRKNKDSQDPTIQRVLSMMTNRLPVILLNFGDFWGRTVAQLNVFPQPRHDLVLEVLMVVEELGKSLSDSTIEIKDETLETLAVLARRVSDYGVLPNPDQ